MKQYPLFKFRSVSVIKNRKGFTVFEAFISMILVSATLAISIPAFRVVNLQRKSTDERLLATTALGNLGERITAENNWNSLNLEKLNLYKTMLINQVNLKEPQLKVSLVEKESNLNIRQVRLQLSWKNPHGQMVDPILLSLWFHSGRSTNE